MLELPAARILIVDDEVRQMTALSETLRDHGYETIGFSSSADALEALRGQKFDLLLTDLMMPDMDGLALLRAAREIDGDVVGVMMTGHGTIDSAVEAMKAGALDYILKPFKLSAILPVLSRALTLRRLRLENAALTKRVSERTAELENANRELEFANNELEAFSYSISHDLRTPLRHIDGFTHLLMESYADQLAPEGQRLLGNVLEGARLLGRLIDDLLNFSRLSRQPLLKGTVSLSSLVQGVLASLRDEREGRDIVIELGHLPECLGDAALLKQVFVNLLTNAFKFTRNQEHASVQIGCQELSGELVCCVRDNGAGFNMQYASKLFGVFQRFHPSSQFEGTGVGLSIVQRIVHRHGGRIWAEAQVDNGAAFHFTLPRAAM